MSRLPAEFADLEPYAEKWCLATESERYATRLGCSMPELQELYAAVQPRAEAALAHCDRYPLDEMPPDAVDLMRLLYSFLSVSFPVEVWLQPRVPDSGSTSFTCYREPNP